MLASELRALSARLLLGFELGGKIKETLELFGIEVGFLKEIAIVEFHPTNASAFVGQCGQLGYAIPRARGDTAAAISLAAACEPSPGRRG